MAVAAIQPGDLGDDEETSAPSTTVTRGSGTTGTTDSSAGTTVGTAGATSTTASTTSTTTAPPPTTTFGTTTTSPGGLGSEGVGQVTEPGEPLANTGGEVPVGVAALLLFSGLALAAVRSRL